MAYLKLSGGHMRIDASCPTPSDLEQKYRKLHLSEEDVRPSSVGVFERLETTRLQPQVEGFFQVFAGPYQGTDDFNAVRTALTIGKSMVSDGRPTATTLPAARTALMAS